MFLPSIYTLELVSNKKKTTKKFRSWSWRESETPDEWSIWTLPVSQRHVPVFAVHHRDPTHQRCSAVKAESARRRRRRILHFSQSLSRSMSSVFSHGIMNTSAVRCRWLSSTRNSLIFLKVTFMNRLRMEFAFEQMFRCSPQVETFLLVNFPTWTGLL